MYHTSLKSRRIKDCFVKGKKFCSTTKQIRRFSTLRKMSQSAVAEEAIKIPQSETTPASEKVYPSKISTIVDQISQLNLLEVADLNELLKARLNIR